MNDLNNLVVNGETLSERERERLAASLKKDKDLAETMGTWRSVLESVREKMAEAPSSEMLILYALSGEPLSGKTQGPESLLSAGEQRRLDQALPEIRAAAERHPSVAAVLNRMREDRAVFDALWEKKSRNQKTFSDLLAPDRVPRPADRKPVRRWGYRVAVAAAVAVFVGIAGSLFLRDFRTETIHASEAQVVALDDGSQVELAEGAELRRPRGFLGGDVRRVSLLRGNALFDVVHDPNRPFRVETRNAEITVLGTTFGVNASRASTEVTLVSGSVNVERRADPETAVTLEPGERSRVVAADAPSEPEPADISNNLGWTGDVYAHDVTLSEVIRRLEERFEVSISVDDGLAEERVTGVFRHEHGVEDALEKLALALDARVKGIDGAYRLVR